MRIVIGIVFLLLFCVKAFSIGANPDAIEIKQPDGTVLKLLIHGDELVNWVTTIDGYRILKNDEGIYEYAILDSNKQIVSSGVKALPQQFRTKSQIDLLSRIGKNAGIDKDFFAQKKSAQNSSKLFKGATLNASFPSSGNNKLLVILASFSDVEPLYPQANFHNLMNQSNYKNIGSFKDYYLENSNGSLNIQSVVTQWVKLPQNQEYYAPESRYAEFAMDAIKQADALGVDFSQFDNNSDGIVDALAIIHVGKGQESSGNNIDIWSHAGNLASYYNAQSRQFDGKYVQNYTTQPEFNSNSTDMCNIGIICHEFGHSLGLPDYYDTNYDLEGSYHGTGKWDIMAYGAYNNNAATPAHHNPFSKAELNWIDIETLSTYGVKTIQPIHSSLTAYRINTKTSNEYFLLENRIKTGFNSALPGEGMLIYHVDESYISSHRTGNNINTGSHQGLYVKVAAGVINSASCTFPGQNNVTEFTDYSTPSSLSWLGQLTNKSITNIIQEADKSIKFNFLALENGSPHSFVASFIDHSASELSWESNFVNDKVLIAYSTSNTFGTPDVNTNYNVGDEIVGGGEVLYFNNTQTALNHINLLPKTTYYYQIWSKTISGYSSNLSALITTNAAPIETYPWNEDFEDGLNNWQQEVVNGFSNWQVNSGGISKKPDASFNGTYNALLYYPSSSNPAVTRLVSPVFKNSIFQNFRLSIQYAISEWDGDQDEVRIYYRKVGDSWTLMKANTTNTPQWKQQYIDFQSDGDFQIAIEGSAKYGHGVVLDDVELMLNNGIAPSIVTSNVAVDNVQGESLTISWVKGNGQKTLVVCREGSEVLGLPHNGLAYSASSNFGAGVTLNPNDYVVYVGDGNQATITNLKINTEYYFNFYDYFDATNYYQPVATKFNTGTLPVNTVFSFLVKDQNSLPFENATVECGGTTLLTNSSGEAVFSMSNRVGNISYSVSKTGFQSIYGKDIGNKSQLIKVTLIPATIEKPEIVSALIESGDATIYWNPVVNEDFTLYEPFEISIPNWIFVDNDKTQTYSLFGDEVTFPNEAYTGAFIVMNPYVSQGIDIPATPYSANQFLGCVAAEGSVNDDWIISPEILIQSTTWFSFMASSYTNNYGLERINVLISEDGVDTENFVSISGSQYLEVPVGWTMFKYDLSSYIGKKVRLAIQCVSDDAFLLQLDNINISNSEPTVSSITKSVLLDDKLASKQMYSTSNTPKLKQTILSNQGDIQYEVYRNGALINTLDGLSNTSIVDEITPCEDVVYSVKATHQSYAVSQTSDAKLLSTCVDVFVNVSVFGMMPINAAMVTLNGQILYTDANGDVTFADVEWGSYLLEVSAPGYSDSNSNIEVGETDHFNVTLNVVTHQEANKVLSLFVHPNPSNGLFNVQLSDNTQSYSYKISSLTGSIIKEIDGDGANFQVDLNNYPVGVYWLSVKANQQLISIKLLKK